MTTSALPVLVAIVLACQVTPRALHAEDQPAELRRVKTLEDLRRLQSVRVGDWEVRVGMADGGTDSGPWELVYCHAKYAGPDAQPRLRGGDGGGEILGPVSLRAAYEPQRAAVAKVQWETGPLPKEALFCQAVPLLRKGTCVVDVLGPQERLLFRGKVVVEEPRQCYWQTFAELRRDGGRATAFLAEDPAAARPQYGGMMSLLPGEGGKPKGVAGGGNGAAGGDQNSLPGAIPLDPRWKALGGLELSAAEGRFTVRSTGPKLYPRPERHLLARWWVNDNPAVPPRHGEGKPQQQAEQVVHAQDMSVPIGLPAHLGELKPGDRVSLQLLYVPNGFDLLPRDEAKLMAQHAISTGRDAVIVPLTSNRVEIAVTEDLLRARKPR
jgi:hypothetical protein